MPAKKRARRAKGTAAGRRSGKRAAGLTRSAPAGRNGRPRAIELALAAFAHEVRTPLTGILAISTLLETAGLGERERRWVETIKASAEHLSALSTLFVDAARATGPGLVVRKNAFALRALTQAAADSLTGRAAAKGLGAATRIDEALPAFAVGDAVRLRAALENLIDNAVKFTDAGRVEFDVALLSASTSKRKSVIVAFSVSDSGIGLTPADIGKLFKPFTQANLEIAERFGGAGLGLSSVRRLARAMGGDVTADRRPGGGMTFKLTVRLELAGEQAAALEPSADARPGGRALKILSVEDNPFGRVVLNAILHELGHRAEFVGRGEDAAERLAQGSFDAVLMDMVLPGIDGVEAIRRIRGARGGPAKVPIVGISGRDGDERAARAAGADAFLVKPVSPRALAATLARVVAG